MVRDGEGTRTRGRPPRRLRLKQRPPLARLIALGAPGSGAASLPAFLANRRALNNQPQGRAASRSWVVAGYPAEPGAQLGSPRAGPGDQRLIPFPPLTVTQAGDSPVAAKCRGPRVADSSAWRASLKKAEGGGDMRVRRVRPPGSPRELITAGAPRREPRRPQVHARLPSAPTHGAPGDLGGDPEGTSPRSPPSCHIARGKLAEGRGRLPSRLPSVHARQPGRGLAPSLSSTGFTWKRARRLEFPNCPVGFCTDPVCPWAADSEDSFDPDHLIFFRVTNICTSPLLSSFHEVHAQAPPTRTAEPAPGRTRVSSSSRTSKARISVFRARKGNKRAELMIIEPI